MFVVSLPLFQIGFAFPHTVSLHHQQNIHQAVLVNCKQRQTSIWQGPQVGNSLELVRPSRDMGRKSHSALWGRHLVVSPVDSGQRRHLPRVLPSPELCS